MAARAQSVSQVCPVSQPGGAVYGRASVRRPAARFDGGLDSDQSARHADSLVEHGDFATQPRMERCPVYLARIACPGRAANGANLGLDDPAIGPSAEVSGNRALR